MADAHTLAAIFTGMVRCAAFVSVTWHHGNSLMTVLNRVGALTYEIYQAGILSSRQGLWSAIPAPAVSPRNGSVEDSQVQGQGQACGCMCRL